MIFAQREHKIRRRAFRIQPPLREIRNRRRVSFSSWSAGTDPCNQRIDLVLAQPRVVTELHAVAGIGGPWRHFAAYDALLDRLRMGPRIVIRNQRERRANFTLAMTTGAMLVKDRCNVLVKCGCRGRGDITSSQVEQSHAGNSTQFSECY